MSDGPKKSRHGCLWLTVALCAVLVIAGTVIVLAALAVGRSLHLGSSVAREWGADEFPDLNEVWAYGSGDSKVVTIPIRGFITLDEGGDLLGDAGMSSQLALLAIRRATHDDEVRAIILDVDSGGGGITASDILYQALMDFRAAQDGRVVVAIFGDVAASGAYYIALAADHIVARPTTVTGSIGVLMQSLNARQLGDKIGVHDVTIKSGRNKDLLNPLEDLTEEQRALLQGIVDDLYARFVGLVAERRDLPEDKVREFADGRVITSAEALRLGLIDEIGYWNDAMAATSDLLEVDDIKVFRYEETFSFSSFLRVAQRWQPVSSLLGRAGRVRLLYQWQM
ncbi:MAG: signal peptide peptidase SppA [Lentisphaerae bacterium]|nr:signal peptide peptidase SppA [Lentisphaerota bacterium]